MAETLLPFDYRPFSSGIRFTKTIYIYREMSVAWLGAVRVGNNTPMPLYRPNAFSFFFSFQVVHACCVWVLYPQAHQLRQGCPVQIVPPGVYTVYTCRGCRRCCWLLCLLLLLLWAC